MAGALDGFRVIDFGQYVAGPLAAMLLADQGADVIRVDPPGGPRFDTPANATWNRNKRSIVLDLKQDGDRDTARQLVETADVAIENFRPGVMDRLGLGAEAMTAANPRLVYCSLPGFAADDARAGMRAWEGVVASAATYYQADLPGGRPTYSAIPIASCYAAFQAVVGITMALNARERDGSGQTIVVPLYDATFGAMSGGDRRRAVAMRGANPVYGQMQCQDGRWVMYLGGNKMARTFLEVTGLAPFVDGLQAGDLSLDEVRERVAEVFRGRTAQEWEDYCAEVGTECAVCRPSAEWLQDAHALDSRIIVDTDDPQFGTVRGPGINVRMTQTPGAIRSPRRTPDADRAEILAELSARKPAPAAAIEDTLRAALDGVKVVDLCIVLAGPTCGRTLAEYGADVIKINRPAPGNIAGHNDVNRGKRSILLDLQTEAGMKVFWRLVQDADVVTQNFRNGVADRLGFGYEAVRARRPDIVYASLNTYGQIGPYAGRPGHEQIAQAASGMQERFGGDGKPTLATMAVNDYGTGFMGAYGVALALLHRKRTGEGQHVDTALAFTATMLQSALIEDFAGKRWDEPRGQDALGSGPLHRVYEASDGWLFLGARPSDLAGSPELADLAGCTGAELERALAERIKNRTVDAWVAALVPAGIGVHRVQTEREELLADPTVQRRGLLLTREHEGLGPFTTNGPTPRLSRTPAVPGCPAPRPGADAASILAGVGLLDELPGLVRDGVVLVEGVAAG